jgi:hypothetical protein
MLRDVIVHVEGTVRSFQYRLTVKGDIDLRQFTVYKNWTDLFDPWPGILMRHFLRVKADAFGWIPDRSVKSLAYYAWSLVPLNQRQVLQNMKSADQRVWFIHAPDRRIEAGIARREGRLLILSRPNGGFRRYPLSNVDLVGCVAGPALFHLTLAKTRA